MTKTNILGIGIKDRLQEANKLQVLFTKYGHIIRTRLGLHHIDDHHSANGGIMILELVGEEAECLAFENELHEVAGVEIQKMVFKN